MILKNCDYKSSSGFAQATTCSFQMLFLLFNVSNGHIYAYLQQSPKNLQLLVVEEEVFTAGTEGPGGLLVLARLIFFDSLRI